jgi:pimeloyl-ACP methyl ester carboxylesterase
LDQPFRSESIEDYLPQNDRRGVVFIHGLACNRGLWTPWLKELRAQGHAFIAVNLEPVFGSIDDYAAIVDAAVQRVRKRTGLSPVLVCHSMGGLAARAWLRNASADVNVHRIVTIGTPHHGTTLARYSIGINGSQMRINSEWLRELESREVAQGYARFICWYSNSDNVVIPAATGSLRGADNRLIPAVGHVALAFCPEVMFATLSMITDSAD